MNKTKPHNISKEIVYESWKEVKANKGSYGIDRVTIEEYERDLENRLYKLWNRMSSGSYFPKAVRRVEIPKADGKTRPLGIPTVEDRIAQTVAVKYIEPILEKIFSSNSYGYRPGKSQHQALRKARKMCWEYDYVLDVDIKGFFDNISHEKLMRAVEKHIEERWKLIYIERWLKAPVVLEDGNQEEKGKGTPQGGVISPILANLYLHYAMDKWLENEYPEVEYERFADDAIIHCKTEREAKEIWDRLAERFRECELELHPEKTKIAYCKDANRQKEYPSSSIYISWI